MSIRVVIIGGKLQGVEALYLAGKAGMDATLVDKNPNVPGRGLCSAFMRGDVSQPDDALLSLLRAADVILPTLEDDDALDAIIDLQAKHGLNVAFDRQAYGVTSSKIRSNALMDRCGVETPASRGLPGPPYIAKPSEGSGSHGVRLLASEDDMRDFERDTPDAGSWVVQPFVAGRQYSVEVVGKPGSYRVFETTELFVDEGYDCKRVEAPCALSEDKRAQMERIAVTLAETLGLTGIMDVEAIDDNGVFRVLEIDARLPSQTPTVVYHASGVNLLAELARVFCGNIITPAATPAVEKHTAFEHYLVENGEIKGLGEHIMSQSGPLRLLRGFMGSDEALTDYIDGCVNFRATFIHTADSRENLNRKRISLIQELTRAFGNGGVK